MADGDRQQQRRQQPRQQGAPEGNGAQARPRAEGQPEARPDGREPRRERPTDRAAEHTSRALQVTRSGGAGLPAPSSLDELTRWARMMAASGFFKDSRSIAAAAVKIAAGAEYGFGPVASMSGIHIIEGNPTLHARLQAAVVKRHPGYDYRVAKLTDHEAVIEFYEIIHGEKVLLGESKFDAEDADQAGLAGGANWRKYPRNMLFARALTNGIGWFCPDVFGGVPTYTPEELGRDDLFDEDGRITAPGAIAPEPVALPDEPLEGEWREVDEGDEGEWPERAEAAHAAPHAPSGPASGPTAHAAPEAGDTAPVGRAWANPGAVAAAAASEYGFNTGQVTAILGKPIRHYADDLGEAWALLTAAYRAEQAGDDTGPGPEPEPEPEIAAQADAPDAAAAEDVAPEPEPEPATDE